MMEKYGVRKFKSISKAMEAFGKDTVKIHERYVKNARETLSKGTGKESGGPWRR